MSQSNCKALSKTQTAISSHFGNRGSSPRSPEPGRALRLQKSCACVVEIVYIAWWLRAWLLESLRLPLFKPYPTMCLILQLRPFT